MKDIGVWGPDGLLLLSEERRETLYHPKTQGENERDPFRGSRSSGFLSFIGPEKISRPRKASREKEERDKRLEEILPPRLIFDDL